MGHFQPKYGIKEPGAVREFIHNHIYKKFFGLEYLFNSPSYVMAFMKKPAQFIGKKFDQQVEGKYNEFQTHYHQPAESLHNSLERNMPLGNNTLTVLADIGNRFKRIREKKEEPADAENRFANSGLTQRLAGNELEILQGIEFERGKLNQQLSQINTYFAKAALGNPTKQQAYLKQALDIHAEISTKINGLFLQVNRHANLYERAKAEHELMQGINQQQTAA